MSPPDSIERLCGAEIAAIRLEEHVHGAERSLLSIFLELPNRSDLRIRGAASGWGLAFGDDPPRAYDMAEHGRVEVVPAGELLGRALGAVASVWTASAPGEPVPVGVRWSTAPGCDVVVYCYDDEFLVAPPDQLELDDVTYSEIC
jgi:hypothetical protein